MFANMPEINMSDPQARFAQAQEEVNALVARLVNVYGLALGANLNIVNFTETNMSSQQTSGVKIFAGLTLTPVDGWTPPLTKTQPDQPSLKNLPDLNIVMDALQNPTSSRSDPE